MTICVEKNGERLDLFIATCEAEISRAQIKRAIETGRVWVNETPCLKAGTKLRVGDCVRWELPESVDLTHPRAEVGIDFRVIFEDSDILVVDKPAGLVVHPGAGNLSGTLVNGLLARYPELASVGAPERPGIVHRLDGETSGLLIVARSQRAYEKCVEMFATHEIHRQYWAICRAPKLPEAGRFDTPYGRHPTQRVKYSSKFESDRRAITDYRVISRNEAGFAVVTCRLMTGRTHQIRVHLSEHQAPIVSDSIYAPRDLMHHKAMARLALHAGKLELNHPISGEKCAFISPFPRDFVQALERLHLPVPSLEADVF